MLNGSEFLQGALRDEFLGIIELLKERNDFELEAKFKIDKVSLNNIKVICTDSNPVNKKQQASEIRLFLQELEKTYRLDNYVSRVVV